MTAEPCAYPLFRQRFLQPLACGDGNAAAAAAAPPPPACAPADPALSPTKAAARMGGLRVLDLRALPRDDGPPTELRARKEKLAHYERQCSRVAPGLYVGAEWVAKSRAALAEAGITHVVNCVGFLYPPYFEPELAYQTLYLQDTPGEDILCVLYDVFDFIEAALEGGSGGNASSGASGSGSGQGGGRVLIHCSQGVSRSATLAIAYLMWKRGAAYDGVFQEVKASRGVANPNIGFICQLLQWHKRRHAPADGARLYRLAPQSAAAPQHLVARPVGGPAGAASLDPRGAFVLHGPASLTVWAGAACPEPFLAAALRFAGQLCKYEGAAGPAAVVRQGSEPDAFWACLAAAAAEGSGSRAGSPAAPGGAGAAAAAAAAEALAAAVAGSGTQAVQENPAYDRDFELYARALSSRSGSGSGDSSARSGRKTPREEHDAGAGSPNERLRKQARGEAGGGGEERPPSRPPSPGKRRREPAMDLTLDDLQPGISTDSAAMQLGKKERVLAEAAASPRLGRSASDLAMPSASDGSQTPRSRGGDEASSLEAFQRRRQQQQQRQPSMLGRPDAAAASGGGGGRMHVPPLVLPKLP